MPSLPRKKSETGIHHVMIRGVAKQTLFYTQKDGRLFLSLAKKYKLEYHVEIYAYCLMSNHVHLLLRESNTEENSSMSEFMRAVQSVYAMYFNEEQDRSGHVFQDRFKSEPVEDDSYFLTVLRYIHQNPERAGLKRFRWTSYDEYRKGRSKVIDRAFPLSLFQTKEKLLEYLEKQSTEKDIVFRKELVPDYKVVESIKQLAKINDCRQLGNCTKSQRDFVLTKLKQLGTTASQIERLAGINKRTIYRTWKQ